MISLTTSEMKFDATNGLDSMITDELNCETRKIGGCDGGVVIPVFHMPLAPGGFLRV